MIKSIKHKGLKRFWEKEDRSKLPASQLSRIQKLLLSLNAATTEEDMNLPGYHMHELKGDLKGYFSVRVTGNYRIVYRFEDEHVYDVDYIDYH